MIILDIIGAVFQIVVWIAGIILIVMMHRFSSALKKEAKHWRELADEQLKKNKKLRERLK